MPTWHHYEAGIENNEILEKITSRHKNEIRTLYIIPVISLLKSALILKI